MFSLEIMYTIRTRCEELLTPTVVVNDSLVDKVAMEELCTGDEGTLVDVVSDVAEVVGVLVDVEVVEMGEVLEDVVDEVVEEVLEEVDDEEMELDDVVKGEEE